MIKAFLVTISVVIISAYFVWAIGRAIDIEFQEAENACELSE
jgi:hypothetical protein